MPGLDEGNDDLTRHLSTKSRLDLRLGEKSAFKQLGALGQINSMVAKSLYAVFMSKRKNNK